MAKRRRINPKKREIELPVPVIHRIQSFLNGRQAAQTALVSKSWYDAWLTSPDLYFNQEGFARRRVFWNFVGRTVQRYEESTLNFNTLYLRLRGHLVREREAKLIRKILSLGVNGIDCKIKIIEPMQDRDFPLNVLQVLESDTVMRLSLLDVSLCAELKELKWSGLKSLRLERVFSNVPGSFFNNAFPCLEDLTLVLCQFNAEFEISSTSLRFLSFYTAKGTRQEQFQLALNVPNIRKLIFFGFGFPSLILGEVSREWEAEVSARYIECGEVYGRWYDNMKLFLERLDLSMCKVTLSIRFCCFKDCEVSPYNNAVDDKVPTVENLMVSLTSLCSRIDKLFDTLLLYCRPKVITQYWFPKSSMGEKGNNKLIKRLCKKMFEDKQLDPYCYLQDVNVEIFEESLGEWQPLNWTTLLHSYKGPENKRMVRFLLDWTDG